MFGASDNSADRRSFYRTTRDILTLTSRRNAPLLRFIKHYGATSYRKTSTQPGRLSALDCSARPFGEATAMYEIGSQGLRH
jgi:hypothetical protein